MSTAWALFWALFGFAMFTAYVSIAMVLAVVVRRRAMEVTCQSDVRRAKGYVSDAHLYCSSLTAHWAGPLVAGVLWPVAVVPLLILARLHRDDVSLARIDRMERELGMKR